MLNIQEYLIQNDRSIKEETLNQLKDELGIRYVLHEDGRVILNYNQIDSPKTNKIVRECRGLVLNSKDWSLVARSFPRFFNWGEHPSEMDQFDWDACFAQDKEDGSLALLYYWNNRWNMNTRHSFGDGLINGSNFKWRNLLEMAMPTDWEAKLDPKCTYVGELCSRYNKVVRDYPSPSFFLLTSFNGENELDIESVHLDAEFCGLKTPKNYHFQSIYDVKSFIEQRASDDKTCEGVVIRDKNNLRMKIKSSTYLQLHRLKNNNFSIKNLLLLILAGEKEEILCYFNELQECINNIEYYLEKWRSELVDLWLRFGCLESQKEFALSVKHHPLSSCLFEARKTNDDPIKIFNSKEELILKNLERIGIQL